MVRRNTRAGEIRHRSWINQEKGGKSDAAYQKFGRGRGAVQGAWLGYPGEHHFTAVKRKRNEYE